MSNTHRFALLTLLTFAGCGAICANAADVDGLDPNVPASLRPPATEVLSLETPAVGVQIYLCSASKADPTRFEWAFKAPEAELFDRFGTNDGSKVVGDVRAHENASDAGAIPWLLLTAKASSGTGMFGQIRSIQRLETVGGKAPAEGCDQSQSGREIRVPYKARYAFFVSRP
jgi:hypothetical protein